MENIVLKKENLKGVPCIINIQPNSKKIVILIHGLSSSKESENSKFMMNFFEKKGIGSISYDQPGHGLEEASKEKLLLENCIESLKAVEDYVSTKYPNAEICYFGSSFGAYVLGIYLARKLNKGSKAFMRCAAVNFPQIILGDTNVEPDPEVLKVLDKQGYIEARVDSHEIRFYREFLEELKLNSMIDIYKKNKPENVIFYFVHGEEDKVVSASFVKEFAEIHGYPILIIPREDHSIRINKNSQEIVALKTYELFMGRIDKL